MYIFVGYFRHNLLLSCYVCIYSHCISDNIPDSNIVENVENVETEQDTRGESVKLSTSKEGGGKLSQQSTLLLTLRI